MRIGNFFKRTCKIAYKIGIASAGATAPLNPISGAIVGVVAVASAISSAVKDKKLGKLEGIINTAACNIDEAQNDINQNYHKY